MVAHGFKHIPGYLSAENLNNTILNDSEGSLKKIKSGRVKNMDSETSSLRLFATVLNYTFYQSSLKPIQPYLQKSKNPDATAADYLYFFSLMKLFCKNSTVLNRFLPMS